MMGVSSSASKGYVEGMGAGDGKMSVVVGPTKEMAFGGKQVRGRGNRKFLKRKREIENAMRRERETEEEEDRLDEKQPNAGEKEIKHEEKEKKASQGEERAPGW